MLEIRWTDATGATPVSVDELVAARAEGRDGFGWVDLHDASADEAAVLDRLDLPPLVVEDVRDDRHQPKVERSGDHLVLVVHALDLDGMTDELRTSEVDLVMAPGLLVTWHERPVASLAAAAARLDDGRLGAERPFDLVHRVLDTMNDVFVPIVDHLDTRLDVVEEDVLSEPTEQTRREIYALQRDLIQLRRVVVPQSEVVRRLLRERPPGWRDGDDALVRDLVDHLGRMTELTGSYQALLGSALDSYRSALDDNLNEMLTTLTVVSAVLLPVTVVAGLFGMNFVRMPGTEATNGFWWTLVGCGVLVVTMLGWFLRKGWIGGRAERAASARRSGIATVLEVPVLGDVLRIPVAGARASVRTVASAGRRVVGRDDG